MTNLYVLNGREVRALGMGKELPPNQETNKTPSAHYDVAMDVEEGDDV